MKAPQSPTNQYLIKNNTELTEDKDKEETFREIWQNIFRITPQENAQYDIENQRMVEEYLRNHTNIYTSYQESDTTRLQGNNEIDTLITLTEIQTIIKHLKNDTPGETKINRPILKNLPISAIAKLQWIFSHTLSMGYFPQKFKTAIMKLLPKPDTDHTNPLNYRPISLLEVTGKLLEKIINNRLRTHLETNNILNDTQHGFRMKRGTDTALTTIHETIAHYTAKKQQCYVILRDVSKAFDKVWHDGLHYKIAQLQLPATITKFLSNFITSRTAKIKIGNFTGPPFPLQAGVPQGSCLSPSLYIVYTNNLPQPAIDCTNIQYADDITQIVTYAGKSRSIMATRTKHEIENQ